MNNYSETNLKPGKKGVTLVEILVALSVASLVMLPIILLFGVTEKITYKSINEVVACNLALQKVEEFKSRPFAELRQIIEVAAEDPKEGPFKEIVLPLELNGVWNTPGVEYARETRLSFYPNIDPDPTQTMNCRKDVFASESLSDSSRLPWVKRITKSHLNLQPFSVTKLSVPG